MKRDPPLSNAHARGPPGARLMDLRKETPPEIAHRARLRSAPPPAMMRRASYARQVGWRVHPCRPGEKLPLL
jgi:hypothetical protein